MIYSRVNSPQVALFYLKNALEEEIESKLDKISIAGSMLNICAILSKLGKHDEGVKYAQRAVAILESRARHLQQEEF